MKSPFVAIFHHPSVRHVPQERTAQAGSERSDQDLEALQMQASFEAPDAYRRSGLGLIPEFASIRKGSRTRTSALLGKSPISQSRQPLCTFCSQSTYLNSCFLLPGASTDKPRL